MSACGEQQARGGAEGLPADMRLVTQAQGSMSAVASVNICELRFRKCMEALIVLGGARTCNLRTAPNFTTPHIAVRALHDIMASAFCWALFAVCCAVASAQPRFPNEAAEPDPLHKTLLDVFDEDKDTMVTLSEVTNALNVYGSMMAGLGGAQQQDPASAGPSEMERMVEMAQIGAPGLFRLLDADSSGALSSKELEWVEVAYGKVRKPMLLKNLTLDVFKALDGDADGELSMEELRAAVDGDAFDKVLALLEDQLPIPVLFKGTLSREAVREQLVTAMGLLDSDGDGKVS